MRPSQRTAAVAATTVAVAFAFAVAVALAVTPGNALAGNPKGAVQDALLLRSQVTESRSARLFGDVASAIRYMSGSRTALLQERTLLPGLLVTANRAMPVTLQQLGAWQPASAFGRGMRTYALWLVGSEVAALAAAQTSLHGLGHLRPPAQERALRAAVTGFLIRLGAINTGFSAHLGTAGTGVPADELAAVSRIS